MKMKLILIFLILCTLQACAVTQPVVGQFSKSKDDFMGEATASMTGTGSLHIKSISGVDCNGTLTRKASLVSGEGEFHCNDGRTGTFIFTKNNEFGGTGFGTLSDGEKIRFLWGNQAAARDKCEFSDAAVTCSRF